MSSNQGRGRTGRDGRDGRGEVVARAEAMEDSGDVRGTVTDSYVAATPQPTRTVRQETVQRRPAPRVTGNREVEIDVPETYALDRDRVRWGPILAGLVTALTTLLALSLLGLAIGLTSVNAGEAVANNSAPRGIGLGAGIWGAISAILAFLLGGWVAGRTAAVFNKGWGALNGMLVFLVAVPFTLWLVGQGLGALVGSLGNLAQALNIDPNAVRDTAQQAGQQAGQQAQQVTPEQAAEAARRARNTAWATLLSIGLGLGAATLGGLLGTRSELTVDEREVNRAERGIVS
ncbi:MAG: hypothetical protein AVDCRST_MAG88-990 [uncultured Thermomicrobiales bacterium]|uniref:Uncharacterized protein n=1 Tax=uncultured Thermomicrobiales bacterium TaxID=1645740 RepID=A0A6J4ULZ3_9BACT|nr:MAG: hypothetical protein AVDCRST_MAG88-990 [uncultured Thermomicrobiales bacterium]